MSETTHTVTFDTHVGAASGESRRYAIDAVLVIPHKPGKVDASGATTQYASSIALATDSRQLVAVTLPGAVPNPVLVPREVAKPGRAELNGTWRHSRPSGRGKPQLTDAIECGRRWPACDHHLAPFGQGDDCRMVAIRINAYLLANMQSALGSTDSPVLTMLIDAADPTHPVRIMGAHGIGVLMPVDPQVSRDALIDRWNLAATDVRGTIADGVRDYNASQ